MEEVVGTAVFYIGTYVTTRYVANYVMTKATEKVIEGSWKLSKKAANAAIDHIIKKDEEPIDYFEYELLEVDEDDRSKVKLDMNKTWSDNGLDDLDCVEFIMHIEKRLNIFITDDVADAFTRYNEKPKVFRSYLRNKKIEQLGL